MDCGSQYFGHLTSTSFRKLFCDNMKRQLSKVIHTSLLSFLACMIVLCEYIFFLPNKGYLCGVLIANGTLFYTFAKLILNIVRVMDDIVSSPSVYSPNKHEVPVIIRPQPVIMSTICFNTVTTDQECQRQYINYNTYQRSSEIPRTEKTIATL